MSVFFHMYRRFATFVRTTSAELSLSVVITVIIVVILAVVMLVASSWFFGPIKAQPGRCFAVK